MSHSADPSGTDPATLVRITLAAAFAGDVAVLDLHPGMTALRAALPKTLAAFPDFSAEFQQQVVDGELVATHWIFRGTHQGEIFGVAPTGKSVQFQNLSIARVENGRIVQFNSEAGWLRALMQMGVLPLQQS